MENEEKNLDSPCGNNELGAENSEWLEENVKSFDQCVKEMLLLIEHDGDVSVEKLQNNIKEISYRHQLLADHYKAIQSANETKNYKKTTSGPQSAHPCQTEISETGGVVAVNEQEHSFETIKAGESAESEMLMRQISHYDEELKVYKEKLESAEKEIAKLKSEIQSNETFMVKMGSDVEKEKERALMLQRQIVDLEANLESEKRQGQELQESLTYYEQELSDRDLEIQKLNTELQDASGKFAWEKRQLESSASALSDCVTIYEARANELQKQCESFEAEKAEMVRNHEDQKITLQDKIDRLTGLVDTLNGLRLNYNTLMAEKNGANAELQRLSADIILRDDQIQCLKRDLDELHTENKQLSAGSACADKLAAELKSRIDELEEKVGMQEVMISNRAEEKRAAIRELSYSIYHFKSAYQHLLNEKAVRKWPFTMFM